MTMDPFIVAIILIVIGALLVITEANVPGGYLIIPGVI